MNNPEIIKCIQIIQKKPKWFFQQQDIAEKIECFDIIRRTGTPSTIYALTDFLKSDNLTIRQKSAESILHLFSQVKFQKGNKDSLKNLQIDTKDLSMFRANFSEEIYIQLLNLASLNGNGYTRESAIKEMLRLNNPGSLKFVIFRLSDWVEPIRDIADTGVNSFLKIKFIDHLIQELPTIDALLHIKRVDLKAVHTRIIEFILSVEISGEFWKRLNRFEDKIRLLYFKHLLVNRKPGEDTVKRIFKDKNFLVRLEVLRIIPQHDSNFQRELIDKFLTDSSARVRIKGLYLTKTFNGEFDNKIVDLLSDESASVRELSRRLLKFQHIALADIYINRIKKNELLSGSLNGLAELEGNDAYLPIFEQHIQNRSGAISLACIIGINKISPEKSRQYSLNLLKHSSKKVRFKAAEMLAKNYDIDTFESIKVIYAEGDVEIEKTILRLYNLVGGWKIIGELLKSLTDESKEIQNIAWQGLSKWKMKATRLFTTPSKMETGRVISIYQNLDKNKMNMSGSREKLLQELQFYLK